MEKSTNPVSGYEIREAYDQYAVAAFQALVPFHQVSRDSALKRSEAEVEDLQKKKEDEVAELAHRYALSMLRKREAFLNSLEPES